MSAFLLASTAVLSLFCLLAALWCARSAARAQLSAERLRQSAGSLPPSVLSRLTDLEDAVALLANKLKMSRVRAAATHAEKSEPDPYTDPDGWRKMMNARIQRQKLGGT